MRRNVLAFLLAGVALAALAFVAPAGAATPGLRAELGVDKVAYGPSDEIRLSFTLHNDTAQELYVVAWRSPLGGFDGDFFAVTRDGEPVPYLGRLYKWATPRAADFVRLPAGGSRTVALDPTALYDMRVAGDYALTFRTELLDPGSLRGAKAGGGAATASNGVAFFLDGMTAAEAAEVDRLAADLDREPLDKYLTPSYVSCSTSRKSTLVSSLSSAQTMATNAYNYANGVPATSRSTNTRYKKWFGSYTSSRYSTVLTHFSNVKNAFATKTFTFYCDCTDSAYAWVYPSQPYKVHLCTAFWGAPMSGVDTKPGTLIHETSHFTVVAGTDDWAYGTSACKSLATSNPSRAVDNADSHEYYAENAP